MVLVVAVVAVVVLVVVAIAIAVMEVVAMLFVLAHSLYNLQVTTVKLTHIYGILGTRKVYIQCYSGPEGHVIQP